MGWSRNLGQDPFKLTLPASDAQLQYAKDSLNIEDFEEAAILQITGLEKLPLNEIPREDMDVWQLGRFSQMLITILRPLIKLSVCPSSSAKLLWGIRACVWYW